MDDFNILAVGDVVGENGVKYIRSNLLRIRKEHNIHFVVLNGENSAKGNGIDVSSAETLFDSGADIVTTGNHVWQKREIYAYLGDSSRLLRPANYPDGSPGTGYTIVNADGLNILVINLLGTVFMDYGISCPFACAERILRFEEGRYDLAVVDFHAEATSEKLAFAHCFDAMKQPGNPFFRISAIFGTHTHVQTSDEKILPNGTGYITDLGMCGPVNSVIGVKTELAVQKFRTRMPVRFETSENEIEFNGVVFCVNRINSDVKIVKRLKF